MARADFYLIAKPRFRDEPLLLVCELAKKAQAAGQPMLVLARDADQAERLDDLLWSFDPDAYVPHQIAGAGFDDDDDGGEDEADVLIAAPGSDVPLRALVLNLRDAPVEGDFERVLEVVPADDSARGPLRERWTQYKARGLDLKKYDM
ncbi:MULTISPECIES: DNA polymerase III subunit chi [unclassified Luteimonas]|uniref:DNA polymerase III subunit chi n=1 Tax=unclassified Luteimonas TaxID=2629088 RepID=UPI0018F0EC52|nr:DNA polymerase III subunit chi [Luteimonas sp. MC1572]MBJ6982393.1 DNA polymerase III subunit chi [Luteimonas sp. MC1572]MBJ7575029.1 DNA polymerase III subunit chi [Luteimonas sp. MC1828]QQO03655.1 DNA polymerase III subunit chi [Luteimonas sp. MC1572]